MHYWIRLKFLRATRKRTATKAPLHKHRQSYPRVVKLAVVSAVKSQVPKKKENGEEEVVPMSFHKVARRFKVDRKRVKEWCAREKKILDSKKGQRHDGSAGSPYYRLMEEQLYGLFLERRSHGLEVDQAWFERHSYHIFEEEYPQLVTTDEDGQK